MRKTLMIALCLALSVPVLASDKDAKPISIGETITLSSRILNEDRPVLISHPTAYENSEGSYPVMYLLDGDAHFHHTTGIIQFLSSIGFVPEMIVVALPNTNRTRDLTPVTLTDTTGRFAATGGGADNFLKFITSELMPYIDRNYRTHPYKVLVGHSFGGLFVINALMTDPDAFDGYIAISPSLWWDNQRLIKESTDFFAGHTKLEKFLYITLGNEREQMTEAAQAFTAVLDEMAPEGLLWEFHHMEKETHGSIPHRTTYNALEKLYADWQLPAELRQAGSLEDFDNHYKVLSKRFGYEVVTPEAAVNALGYRLIGEKKLEEAIMVFKRNVEEYPESANVYDSLGDGYDAAGDDQMALKNYEIAYKKAVETSHPNLQVYKNNFERMSKKLSGQ